MKFKHFLILVATAILILKLTGVLTSWGWWIMIGACFIPAFVLLIAWLAIVITATVLGIVFGGKR